MSRVAKTMMWGLLGLIATVAICVIFLATFDWNRAKPWLSARVSEATERSFAINGDLSLTWQRSKLPGAGLAAVIPWPRLSAREVTLGNPEGLNAAAHMAEIKHVTFTLNPLPLLDHRIVIPNLLLDQPRLSLRREKDGRNNWTFPSEDDPSRWKLALGRLQLTDGLVHLVDALKKADITAEISTLPPDDVEKYGLRWKLDGRFNNAAVSGGGKAGAILSLRDDSKPYPIDADLRVGKTAIAVTGTLTKPAQLAALNMHLKLSGASMANLYPIIGVLLPETPPFATQGRLQGVLDKEGNRWIYEKFSGKVGASDLSGTLEYRDQSPRPHLSGSVASNLLRLKDLGPLIGAGSASDNAQRGEKVQQPAGKALPAKKFATKRWTTLDADIKFTGRKIDRDKDLPIDDLVTTLQLKDGVLKLKPLNFGVAGGNLVSTVTLDGRGDVIRAQMTIAARRLKLKQLLPAVESMKASIGEINGDASLSATGNSVASLLAKANGEVKALVNHGTVSKLLLEQIGLNVGSIIVTRLFGDRQVELNCMASDFAVSDGVMRTRIFVVDTDTAVLSMEGTINLAQEQLALTILPRSRNVRVFSLRSPLYVSGSFKQPKIGVDKGILAAKAGGAIALGALAPLAALLPLVETAGANDSGCNRLLRQAAEKPQAPTPGKRANHPSTPQ